MTGEPYAVQAQTLFVVSELLENVAHRQAIRGRLRFRSAALIQDIAGDEGTNGGCIALADMLIESAHTCKLPVAGWLTKHGPDGEHDPMFDERGEPVTLRVQLKPGVVCWRDYAAGEQHLFVTVVVGLRRQPPN